VELLVLLFDEGLFDSSLLLLSLDWFDVLAGGAAAVQAVAPKATIPMIQAATKEREVPSIVYPFSCEETCALGVPSSCIFGSSPDKRKISLTGALRAERPWILRLRSTGCERGQITLTAMGISLFMAIRSAVESKGCLGSNRHRDGGRNVR
jgi:hypothetical protein